MKRARPDRRPSTSDADKELLARRRLVRGRRLSPCVHEGMTSSTTWTGALLLLSRLASCGGGQDEGGDGQNCATVICAASDQCHDVGTCNPATGACSNPPKSDGTACTNGDGGAGSASCQAGICVGGGSALPSSSAVIGPNGGTLSLNGGPSVVIPPGAVAAPTMLTISAMTTSPPSGALTRVFAFGPDGLTFSVPITVTFSIPAQTIGATVYWTGAGDATTFGALPSRSLRSLNWT